MLYEKAPTLRLGPQVPPLLTKLQISISATVYMVTLSDIITLSAQNRVPPLGAPISLNTVCILYGGGGGW